MRSFALGILAGLVLVYGGLAATYAGLAVFRPANLPAPAISRLVPLDEKLRFLRQNRQLDPRVLAVGSSITWRQIAGDEFVRVAGGGAFLNGATGYLKIHQTRDLLDFYLERYANVRTVLLFTGPPDFEDCTEEPAAMLDHGAAAAYAFEQAPDFYFYLRYFSPQRYLRSALTLDRRTQPLTGDLSLDRYGSSPLQVPARMQAGLRYGAVAHDPACADALSALARELADREIGFVVVFAPVHPDYRREFPKVVAALRRVARQFEDRGARLGARVVNLIDDDRFAAVDYFDAFHLQWPAVRRLSRHVARAIVAMDRPDQLAAPTGQHRANEPLTKL